MSAGGPGLPASTARITSRLAVGESTAIDFDRGGGESEIARIQHEFPYRAVAKLRHVGRRREAHLVEPVLGVHHHHVLAAQLPEHAGERLDELAGEDSDNLAERAGRVGQRGRAR